MSNVSDPAAYAATVVPADGTDLPGGPARSLYIGGAGTLRVTMYGNGAVVDFPAVSAGPFPFQVIRVHATGTTATGIVAAWG